MRSISAVALFTRAWIEMGTSPAVIISTNVALFTRAWIEINKLSRKVIK